jgi:UDP-glucose:(galactosyl)LPS alpha-1,2-glucosyltransferase
MVIEERGNNKIPVVLAFTPDYFVAASTCLLSILKQASAAAHFHVICLLSLELDPGQKGALQLLGKDRAEFTFLDLQDQLRDVYVDKQFSIATMFRLLTPELLKEYDKVIYIDCDIIVQHDLEQIYQNTELGNNYLAGVKEAPLAFQLGHLHEIGASAAYINAGFLLMNLKSLREDHIVPEFISMAQRGGLRFFDQDILNIVCKGRILFLPPYYNSIRTFYLPQYKAAFLNCYTEEDYLQVMHRSTAHYTGAKPWNTFTVKFDLWWDHYEALPDSIKSYGQVNRRMQKLYYLYRRRTGRYLVDVTQSLYRKLKY